MRHHRGRADYKLRAQTVEPVFGQIKACMKMTAMSRRGISACRREWLLAATAHTLLRAPLIAPTCGPLRAAPGEVEFKNSDDILHNLHTYSTANPSINKAQPKFKKTMTEKLELKKFCRHERKHTLHRETK